MNDISKNNRVIFVVQPQLLSILEAHVASLTKAECDAVSEGVTVPAAIHCVALCTLLVDLFNRYDFKNLQGLQVFRDSNYRDPLPNGRGLSTTVARQTARCNRPALARTMAASARDTRLVVP
jgi:hypothetical protein